MNFDIAPETPGLFTRPDYYELLATLRREAPVYEYEPGSWTVAGAALARLEARVLLDEMLDRFPGFEASGDPHWVPSTLVRGMDQLPVTMR